MFAAGRGGVESGADGEGILRDEDVGILLVAVLEQRDSGAGERGGKLAQPRPAGLRIGRSCGKDAGEVEDGIERGKWAKSQVCGPRGILTRSLRRRGCAAARTFADPPKNDVPIAELPGAGRFVAA
jgi:hypothetical protein